MVWAKSWQTPRAADDGLVDRRVDARGAGHVFEVVEEALVQLLHEHAADRRAGRPPSAGPAASRAGVSTRTAGQQHLPVVAASTMASRACHASGERKCGNVGQRLLLHHRLGHDDELVVLAGNVEVLHVVAEVIAIAEDAAARADGEREGEAVLVRVGARMHARLHDALADRAASSGSA